MKMSKDTEPERDETEHFTDEDLAAAAKRGDHKARNALFQRHRATVLGLTGPAKWLLLRRLAPRPGRGAAIEPEDIEQQAFLIFCDLLEEWEPQDGALARYLAWKLPGRLLHYVRDTLHPDERRVWPRPALGEGEEAETREERGEAQPAPDTEMDHAESLLMWQAHTGDLPALLRETVTLRFYEDLSYSQIARIKNRTRRTVGRNLRAALSIVRDGIYDQWEH